MMMVMSVGHLDRRAPSTVGRKYWLAILSLACVIAQVLAVPSPAINKLMKSSKITSLVKSSAPESASGSAKSSGQTIAKDTTKHLVVGSFAKDADYKSLINSPRAHENKVSYLMQKVHQYSEHRIKQKGEALAKKLDNSNDKDALEAIKQYLKENENLVGKKPEEMLKELCPRSLGLCSKWVESRQKEESPILNEMAKAVIERPPGVEPKRIFKHKLYEAGVGELIKNDYDKHLNFAIDLATKRNPYLFVPATMIDMSIAAAA